MRPHSDARLVNRALRCSSALFLQYRHSPMQRSVKMARASTAPPRRKSCGACVAAKRRCDLALPSCSRCRHRDIVCEYPVRQSSANQVSFEAIECAISASQTATSPVMPVSIENIDFSQTSITGILLDPMDSDWNPMNGLQANLPRDSSWDLLLSSNFELAMPRTKPLRPLSEIIASKLQFAVDVLKNAPSMMVLETQLPWCHSQLYKKYMPRAMQGEFILSNKLANNITRLTNFT